MTKSSIDPQRLYWIDAIRSFACICVITTHAPIPNGSDGRVFVAFFNYFSVAGASILFFMISGALVLYKPKPVLPFLKKRLSRIVFPMVFWTIISLLFDVFVRGMSWNSFLLHVIRIPIGPQVGTYWFIYVIFGIYLLTPILATWLERCSKRDLQFYLLVWSITLLMPYFKCLKVMVDFTHGYLWFAVMGYYIRRYVNISKFTKWHYSFFTIIVLLPGFLYCLPLPHDVIQDRMSINVVILCVCYFIILKHLKYSEIAKRLCFNFAQHSFGIYLVHIIIMRDFLWPLLSGYNLNYLVQIPLVVLLTALFSYLVVKLFSYLPFSKYLVGV